METTEDTDSPFASTQEQTVITSSRVAPGTVFGGRYEIEDLIAHGGYATVYSARHLQTGQSIAIKILDNECPDDRKLQRFYREARVTSSLKHPNTIRVFDFGQESGLLYIAMELLKGESLAQLAGRRMLEGRVFAEHEAIEIGLGITRSLGEAHALGVVHRDLKPANIFLQEVDGSEPVLKVLDFGIVKLIGSSPCSPEVTAIGTVPGTPNYMSPEQALGITVDGRSDLYSLGIILYELVAGAPPFASHKRPEAILHQQVHGSPPSLRSTAQTPISDAFVRVVERALRKNPDHRFPVAAAFRHALESCHRPRSLPDASSEPRGASPEVGPGPDRMYGGEPRAEEATVRAAAPATALRPSAPDPKIVSAATSPDPIPGQAMAALDPFALGAQEGITVRAESDPRWQKASDVALEPSEANARTSPVPMVSLARTPAYRKLPLWILTTAVLAFCAIELLMYATPPKEPPISRVDALTADRPATASPEDAQDDASRTADRMSAKRPETAQHEPRAAAEPPAKDDALPEVAAESEEAPIEKSAEEAHSSPKPEIKAATKRRAPASRPRRMISHSDPTATNKQDTRWLDLELPER